MAGAQLKTDNRFRLSLVRKRPKADIHNSSFFDMAFCPSFFTVPFPRSILAEYKAFNRVLIGMGTNMKIIKILVLMTVFLSLTFSCVVAPSPWRGATEILQNRIAVGSTSREEVIAIYGKPDVTRERWVLYTSRAYDSGVEFVGCPQEFIHRRGSEYMDLFFEFDNNDTLTNYRVDKYNAGGETIE
jgi:hypothetical protein